MKKKICFLMIICIFLQSQIYCQNTSFIPQYLPQLPEVAGFKRYGDIPVGEYTGTPDISIPLYTVKQGTLELPIKLSYHASGIKVEQEASWVGLGWDLIAGAAIALEPVGDLDPQQTTPIYDAIYWNNFNAFITDWRPHYSEDYTSTEFLTSARFGTEDESIWWDCDTHPDYLSVLVQGVNGKGERDVYSGNLPNGKSFKFVIHPYTCAPVMVGKSDNLLISYGATYIIVVDSDGTSYRFEGADFFSNYTLSYRLKSITSKEGHTIQLTYTTVNERTLPSIHESYTFNSPPGGGYASNRSYSNMTSGLVYYLSKIESDTEQITFEMNSRTDKSPGITGRLCRMKIKNKLTQKELFYYDFSHDYFTGVNKGGDFLGLEEYGSQYNSIISEDTRKKRLKFLSLTKRDMTNKAAEIYTFTYNEATPLPYKTSFARDYWGYYNGAENNSTLLPPHKRTLLPNMDPRFANIFSSILDYPETGAIRNSSKTYITAGILKSITYPTGGKVEFEFEPHTFSNSKTLPKEAVDSYNSVSRKNVSNYTAEGKNMSETFTIPFRQTITLRIQVYFGNYTACDLQGTGASIRSVGSGGGVLKNLQVTNEDCTNHLSEYIERFDTITLNPGQYAIACGMTKSIEYSGYNPKNLIEASVAYRTTEFVPDAWPSIGAGVRIKTITAKDKDNSVLETVKYTYEDVSGKSSGKLLSPLDFVKSRGIHYVTHYTDSRLGFDYYQSQSYGIISVSSSSTGLHPGSGNSTPVGYSRVICEKISNSFNSGKMVSEFSNTPAERIGYGMIIFDPNNNGALIKQQVYNSNNSLLRQNIYEYEVNDINKTMLNVTAEDSYYNITTIKCLTNPSTGGFADTWSDFSNGHIPRFNVSLSPSVSYRVDLKNSSETFYYNGSPVTGNTAYIYNTRHQPLSITKNTSQADKSSKETFTYRVDVDNDMKTRNILSPVSTHVRTVGSSGTTITNQYANWQEKFVLLSTKEQSSGSTNDKTVKYKYDSKQNPVEVTYQNEVSEVYLWGYNYSYVIANIKNVTYSTVQSRMGDNLTRLCSANAPDITLLNSLRTLFPESLVTTYLYKPSIGIKQQTDPSGLTTTYEYDTFGRLIRIKDPAGKIIQSYNYHYQNQ